MDIFVPDIYAQSIYTINYKKLTKKGIKCLIFSLDNTIASYDTLKPSKNLKEFFHELEKDFKVIIVSNNSKNRVRPFKEQLNLDSAFNAHKPSCKKLKKILDIYNLKDIQIAFVGDQLLTDVWAANKMGFTSILVNPISYNEPMRVKMNRYWERKIIKKLNKIGLLIKGEYYE